jgi:hypothetical protein
LEASRVPLYCKELASFCTFEIWKAEAVGVQRQTLIETCKAHILRVQNMLSRYPEWKLKGDEILRPFYEWIGRERVTLKSNEGHGQLTRRHKQFIRRFGEIVIPG